MIAPQLIYIGQLIITLQVVDVAQVLLFCKHFLVLHFLFVRSVSFLQLNQPVVSFEWNLPKPLLTDRSELRHGGVRS